MLCPECLDHNKESEMVRKEEIIDDYNYKGEHVQYIHEVLVCNCCEHSEPYIEEEFFYILD